MTEHTGDDRMQVSVHYHGKDEETGVWQDRRTKDYFPQSNYAYSRSELYFDIDGQHDATWITMKVNHDEIEANLGRGEHWDSTNFRGMTHGIFWKLFPKQIFCCIVTSLRTMIEGGHVASTGGGF